METKNKQEVIIADASGLISLTIPTDKNYNKAIRIGKYLIDKSHLIYIPEEIFAEMMNILGKKFGHDKASQIGENLHDESIFFIIKTDKQTRLHALELFRKSTSSVSFTDCIVMATADEYKTKHIFGFDDVFKKTAIQPLF